MRARAQVGRRVRPTHAAPPRVSSTLKTFSAGYVFLIKHTLISSVVTPWLFTRALSEWAQGVVACLCEPHFGS